MQYTINLPADYDMAAIRARVAARAGALDRFPGLGIKAYLIRERGREGAEANQYAPFYLWNRVEAMNRFLWDGPFDNIIGSFGRPPVEHWTGQAFEPGPAFDDAAAPSGATRHTVALDPDRRPGTAVAEAAESTAARAKLPGVYAAALAADPYAWRLVHFTLWRGAAPQDAPGVRYQVLRLNTPGRRELPVGRH